MNQTDLLCFTVKLSLAPYMRFVVPMIAVFATVCSAATARASDSARCPNIIFILSDDIAQGDLGCYGQQLIKTPNLDRMAAEGTRFMQAYCGTSVCAPSRSALMTGLHMGHCPIRANREIQPEGQMPLPEGTFTVAKLRGFKRGMYEGALRQAALVRWPGQVPAGRVSDQPWAFWDFLPTAAELAGTSLPDSMKTDGLSLVPFLKGGDAPDRDYFYWELHEGASIRAVRFGDWKAVQNGPSQPIELYDLNTDVGETKNLAAEKPDLVAKAERLMKEARVDDPNWPLRDGQPPRAKRNSKNSPKRKALP